MATEMGILLYGNIYSTMLQASSSHQLFAVVETCFWPEHSLNFTLTFLSFAKQIQSDVQISIP